ncbi:MAG: hypothetical protein ACFHU9_00170 [Fluviicola sp.]
MNPLTSAQGYEIDFLGNVSYATRGNAVDFYIRRKDGSLIAIATEVYNEDSHFIDVTMSNRTAELWEDVLQSIIDDLRPMVPNCFAADTIKPTIKYGEIEIYSPTGKRTATYKVSFNSQEGYRFFRLQ